MTDPITDAVRAGCGAAISECVWCPCPECECDGYEDVRRALETAARFARNAALEEIAALIATHDECADPIGKRELVERLPGDLNRVNSAFVTAILSLKIGDPT